MWLWVLLPAALIGPYQHRDAFDYPNGSEGEPTWFAESVAWEVRDGRLVVDGGGKTFAVLQAAPHGRRVAIEAVLTVDKRAARDWAIAGVAVRRDARHYWHLALVEAPDEHGNRHFVELQEMLDGKWLAADAPETKLTRTSHVGGDFAWKFGRPYRLRVAMAPEGIEGTVAELDGTVRTRLACKLDNKAVTSGQPAVDCSGFIARFDDVVATVDDVVPAPTKPKPDIKSYTLKGFDRIRGKATGFFYPKQIDGTWWMIDPNGRGFYMVGTDHISYHVHWCEKLGYAPYHRNMKAKYGSEAAWADVVAGQLEAWGFNTLPANHSRLLRHRHFAHILWCGWGSGFSPIDDIVPKTTWTGVPNVFSPKWARHCDKLARRQCAPNKDDPWVIGYFIDNELEWYGKIHTTWGVFVEAWKKPAEHSAKQAWLKFVRQQVQDIKTFNAHWGTKLTSFDELAKHTEPGQPKCDAAKDVAHGFLRLAVERYFKIAAEAIRRYDPNHLVLGCRFAGGAPDIWDIAGKYCDVVSLNTYPRIDVEMGVRASFIGYLKQCHAKCGRPMMITEWSFPALDAGLPCKHGAGMRVDTQAQKTKCFQHYQTLLFSLPFMVGSNYFMWVDEPALGISKTFPEDSNYGLTNVDGKPYKLLTEACARLNPRVYELHLAGKIRPARPQSLAPWTTNPPRSMAQHPPVPVDLSVGPMRVTISHGGDACRLQLGDRVLGSLTSLLHQDVGQHMWVRANRAKLVAKHVEADATALDLELSYAGGDEPITRVDDETGQRAQRRARPHRYRAGWRIRVPTRSVKTPFITSQCLWVENTDSQPWHLVEVFHWIAPSIGGDPAGDEPDGVDVPNYYLPAGGWVDRQAGLGVGVVYTSGSGYACRYWRDKGGGIHSDLRLEVDKRLAPGQRHKTTAPPVFVFGYHAKEPRAMSLAAAQVLPEVLGTPR